MLTNEQVFDEALTQLRLQMTRPTFDTHLSNLALVQAKNGTWTIGVNSEFSRAWLQGRLRPTVERALANIAGREIAVEFVLAPEAEPTNSNGAPASTSAPASAGQELARADYKKLWYARGGAGYAPVPHYASQFWQAYLKARAFGLWLYIESQERPGIPKTNIFWTRPRSYKIRALARKIGCSPGVISGRLRQCIQFNQAQEEGEEWENCHRCHQRYNPTRIQETRDGRPVCVHWDPGIFEQLYDEGLLAIRVSGDANNPRSVMHYLQMWRLLPLLTPYQAAQLGEADQESHHNWLRAHGHIIGLDLSAWESITETSLVPLLPGYNTGREINDVYQPNPLIGDTCHQ